MMKRLAGIRIRMLSNGCPIAIREHKGRISAITFAKGMTEMEVRLSILKDNTGWRPYNTATERFTDR